MTVLVVLVALLVGGVTGAPWFLLAYMVHRHGFDWRKP